MIWSFEHNFYTLAFMCFRFCASLSSLLTTEWGTLLTTPRSGRAIWTAVWPPLGSTLPSLWSVSQSVNQSVSQSGRQAGRQTGRQAHISLQVSQPVTRPVTLAQWWKCIFVVQITSNVLLLLLLKLN